MNEDQLIIKIVLIIAFALFAVFLMFPGRGARHLALRRLAMLLLFGAAVFAIAFPQVINAVANFVGVGRGTDLLLYGFIIVFVANSLTLSRRQRHTDKQITELARRLAIAEAPKPGASDTA